MVQPIVFIHLNVGGMTCDDCVHHVTQALAAVPGVERATVDLETRSAVVEASPDVPAEALGSAIRASGKYNAPRRRSSQTQAAIKATELGARVAIVGRRTLGGTCANRGCLPSKNLFEAARIVHDAAHPRYLGLVAGRVGVVFGALIAQKITWCGTIGRRNKRASPRV